MYLNSKEYGRKTIDLSGQRLPRLTQLYLFRGKYTIKEGSYEEFAQLVVDRISTAIDEILTTVDFRGIEEFTYTEQLKGLVLLIRANIEDIIVGLHGYNTIPPKPKKEKRTRQVKNPYFVRVQQLENPHFIGIQKANHTELKPTEIFWTNLRLFIQTCFQDPRLRGILKDVIESKILGDSEEQFLLLASRFRAQIRNFSYSEIPGYSQEDLQQEGLLVLQSCIENYSGENFVPLQRYLSRALKNRKIDLIRATERDKRKVNKCTIPCAFGNGEPFFADREVERMLVADWTSEHHTWLHGNDGNMTPPYTPTMQVFTNGIHGDKFRELNEITFIIFEQILNTLGDHYARSTIHDFIEVRYGIPYNNPICIRKFIREFWQNCIQIIPLENIDIEAEDSEDSEDTYAVRILGINPELLNELF